MEQRPENLQRTLSLAIDPKVALKCELGEGSSDNPHREISANIQVGENVWSFSLDVPRWRSRFAANSLQVGLEPLLTFSKICLENTHKQPCEHQFRSNPRLRAKRPLSPEMELPTGMRPDLEYMGPDPKYTQLGSMQPRSRVGKVNLGPMIFHGTVKSSIQYNTGTINVT